MPRMKLHIFSSSWNQKLVAFHSFMLLYSGNPNHTIFNLGKPSCFLYETVSCLLKGDPMFRFKIFFLKNKFLKILRTCWYMTWGIFVNISSFISSIKYLYGSHLKQKRPIWSIWGKIPIVYTTIKKFLFQYLRKLLQFKNNYICLNFSNIPSL